MADDGRRAQWFAVGAHFFDGDLGMALRERFGPMGLLLFIGLLAGCKRSSVQGTLRFSSDAEALLLMGLPNLQLVDEAGDNFDLETFWRWLGQRKQTRKTRRGRVWNVQITRWEQWQQGFRSQREAEQKRRSRQGNTPPVDRTNNDDAPPVHPSDSDIDNDSDNTPPTPPVVEVTSASQDAAGEGGSLEWETLGPMVAERLYRQAVAKGESIHTPPGWKRHKIESLRAEWEQKAMRVMTRFPDLQPHELAQYLAGEGLPLRHTKGERDDAPRVPGEVQKQRLASVKAAATELRGA